MVLWIYVQYLTLNMYFNAAQTILLHLILYYKFAIIVVVFAIRFVVIILVCHG